MASSGNTWFKKLRAKKRKFELRHTKARWAVDNENLLTAQGVSQLEVREYLAPVKPDFVPRKPRGRSGCRMSHAKRLLVLDKALRRAEFFASLGVSV